MTISTIPRTVVKASLQGIRLPLTAIERMTNHTESQNWPPTVAFEGFEASVKQVVGSVIRDQDLVEEGRLQRAKISELAEAERLRVKAEQTRTAADDQLERRRQAANEARERAEREERERQQQVARDEAEERRRVQEDASRRSRAAAKTEQALENSVKERERESDRVRIEEESAALGKRSQALGAARRADSVDKALQTKKAARKSG